MKIKKTNINKCYLIIPQKNNDLRGSFHRSFCEKILKKNKIKFHIKQTNISINKKKNTLRGFHFQKYPFSESKILNCINGSIYNVTIDLRKKSKTYLKKFSCKLNGKKNVSILIPAGCANAFLTLENNTIIHYYMDSFFEDNIKTSYSGFRYDDEIANVKWPKKPRIISQKDKNYLKLNLKYI